MNDKKTKKYTWCLSAVSNWPPARIEAQSESDINNNGEVVFLKFTRPIDLQSRALIDFFQMFSNNPSVNSLEKGIFFSPTSLVRSVTSLVIPDPHLTHVSPFNFNVFLLLFFHEIFNASSSYLCAFLLFSVASRT